MTAQHKIDTLEKQRAALATKIQGLQRELDEAADAGDTTLIAQLQVEIDANQHMVDSYDRRLAKARSENTEDERQARRDANTQRAETFARETAKLISLAAPVGTLVAQLAEQLKQVRDCGLVARQAVAELVRQVPYNERPASWSTVLHGSDMQDLMGVILEDLMQKYGVFEKLAPNGHIVMRSHGLSSITEALTESGGVLHQNIKVIAEKLNAGI